jgi:hypothetical protein
LLDTAKQQPLMSNGFKNKHICTATIGNSNRGTAFSVWSVPKYYKHDSESQSSKKLCRQQAEVIQTHENEHVCSIGHCEARHRKYKRLKLGGGQTYDRSSD